MEKRELSPAWNQIIYFVSDVYSITRGFGGNSEPLGIRMRRAAVAVSAILNSMPWQEVLQRKHDCLYPLLSSIAILETYLILAKNQHMGVNLAGLEERLIKLKDLVGRMVDDANCGTS